MQPMDTAREIGRLETGLWMTNRRIDDLWRTVAMLHKNGHGHGKSRIQQFAAMGFVALASLLGILKPELAASLLKALAH